MDSKSVAGNKVIVLPKGTCQDNINAVKCTYGVRLNAEIEPIVPRGNDICGIQIDFKSMPPELSGVSLEIGAQRCLYWDREALENGKELLGQILCDEPFILPMSLSSYMVTDLKFHFDVDMMSKKLENSWETVQQEPNCEDTCVYEFIDEITGSLHRGTKVYRCINENTNTNPIENIVVSTHNVEMQIPEMTVFYTPSKFDHTNKNESVMVSFWDPIDYEPSDHVIKKWGVRESCDGTKYVCNAINFTGGMAGVCLSHK